MRKTSTTYNAKASKTVNSHGEAANEVRLDSFFFTEPRDALEALHPLAMICTPKGNLDYGLLVKMDRTW
jgi:hypothetical protein